MVGAARRLATELVVIIASATQEIHWVRVAAGACAGTATDAGGRQPARPAVLHRANPVCPSVPPSGRPGPAAIVSVDRRGHQASPREMSVMPSAGLTVGRDPGRAAGAAQCDDLEVAVGVVEPQTAGRR